MNQERPSLAPSTPGQRRALGIFALAAVAALIWLALPIASGIFLGTLLAFSLLRLHERLAVRIKQPGLAALILSLGSGGVILVALVVLVYFVVARGIIAANTLAHGFEPEGALRKTVERFEETTRSSLVGPIDVMSHVRTLAADAATKLTGWTAAVAGATLSGLLILFFTIMTAFFVLRHWAEIAAVAERLLPLHPAHTRVVLSEFQSVGREVFVGTILTGLAQGVFAAIGYKLAGVPEPALLGALTAVASLVPAVGTLLVWVPAGVLLIAAGHPVAGIFELAWGALVVGVFSDYVLRPRLVGGKGHIPTLLTFVSLFGGVEVFGLVGLVIGPVIASVALAMLRTYDRETRSAAAALRVTSGDG
jgi:predicted PurR-regulated permease PerM